MKPLLHAALWSLTLAVALIATSVKSTAQTTPLIVYDFHLGPSPTDNVDYVKSLGFAGVVTRLKDAPDLAKLERYARYTASMDDFRLLAYVAYDFTNEASPQIWRRALPTLAKSGAPLWVVVRKAPSDQAIRELLLEMAEASQEYGVRTVIYPHWDTNIETAEEADVFIDAIRHPNLANSLHTCHEIRGGNQYDMESVVAEHAGNTALVAIAGAKENAYAGPPNLLVNWSDVIKPLDKGNYSLLPFLQALEDAGYEGPVILQTYGILNTPGHLEASIEAYDDYLDQIVPKVED